MSYCPSLFDLLVVLVLIQWNCAFWNLCSYTTYTVSALYHCITTITVTALSGTVSLYNYYHCVLHCAGLYHCITTITMYCSYSQHPQLSNWTAELETVLTDYFLLASLGRATLTLLRHTCNKHFIYQHRALNSVGFKMRNSQYENQIKQAGLSWR